MTSKVPLCILSSFLSASGSKIKNSLLKNLWKPMKELLELDSIILDCESILKYKCSHKLLRNILMISNTSQSCSKLPAQFRWTTWWASMKLNLWENMKRFQRCSMSSMAFVLSIIKRERNIFYRSWSDNLKY